MPERSQARTNAALVCLLLATALLAGLLSYLLPDKGRVLGPAFQAVIQFLIARVFGLTVFFLPIGLFVSGYFLLKRPLPDCLTRLPRLLISGGGALFFLNVLLCNTPVDRGPWAGFFPLLTHALSLHYLGANGHATLATWLVELFAAGASGVWFAAEWSGHPPHAVLAGLWKGSRKSARVAGDGMAVLGRTVTGRLSAAGVLVAVEREDAVRYGVDPDAPHHPVLRKVRHLFAADPRPEETAPDEALQGDGSTENRFAIKSAPAEPATPEPVVTAMAEAPLAAAVDPAPAGRVENDGSDIIINLPDSPTEAPPPGDPVDDVPAWPSSPEWTDAPVAMEEKASAPQFTVVGSPDEEGAQDDAEVELDLSALAFGRNPPKDPAMEESSVEGDAAPAKPKGPRMPVVVNSAREASPASARADVHVLEFGVPVLAKRNEGFIRETALKLEQTIRDFGVETKVVEVSSGPVITRFELSIESGVKISKIVNLSDNIALSLAAPSVRIVAPIPGKSVIGIEIPNLSRQMVRLRDVVDTAAFRESRADLPIALGKAILGEPVVADLASTPHLLIAGATGSGKSVCVNAVLCSLLFRLPPSEIRLLLIDPKMVELNVYNGIPHLLAPVITDAKKAALSLRWIIAEMEARYALLEKYGVRSIKSYNELVRERIAARKPPGDDVGTLPYIVVVIDEFADLMMIARKEVEDSVTRLAAMSRAVGIHLILATQRPSVDVITGIIKANFPSRIAFQVSSKVDSRTILDSGGADKLLGKGDMLFQKPSEGMPERIQGAFLSDGEVARVVENLRGKGAPDYLEPMLTTSDEPSGEDGEDLPSGRRDPMWEQALDIVIQEKKASASYLQRRLKIGYNRAARIIEEMETLGLVGAQDGSRAREVLVSSRP
ncbi:MAG: DNA translocase FtsK [Spirochaetes bacterium]|nr:DNA translocase FtsK [Spirochaetota bacterium]